MLLAYKQQEAQSFMVGSNIADNEYMVYWPEQKLTQE